MNSKNASKLTVINTHTQNKRKLSQQLEQKQNHRNGDHMEGYQYGIWRGRDGGKVQRINSVNDRWKIDRGSVRIV